MSAFRRSRGQSGFFFFCLDRFGLANEIPRQLGTFWLVSFSASLFTIGKLSRAPLNDENRKDVRPFIRSDMTTKGPVTQVRNEAGYRTQEYLRVLQ
jgi:hypothetical protein